VSPVASCLIQLVFHIVLKHLFCIHLMETFADSMGVFSFFLDADVNRFQGV
jgi:hypothetical protein